MFVTWRGMVGFLTRDKSFLLNAARQLFLGDFRMLPICHKMISNHLSVSAPNAHNVEWQSSLSKMVASQPNSNVAPLLHPLSKLGRA